MQSFQIDDVPDRIHDVLEHRAAEADQSLPEYVLTRLIRDADTPTLDEVLDQADGRVVAPDTFIGAADVLRAERER